MNDKELLELAARAFGIDVIGPMGNSGLVLFSGRRWNPLSDDGDALRLAVKLNIDISFDEEAGLVSVLSPGASSFKSIIVEDINNDWYEATRRAIVRAAAEIGKAMQG